MRLKGVWDYHIEYSLIYGDTVITRTSMVMKSCFSAKHALERFNILMHDRIDPMNDIYINIIERVN